jgi:hypothetical protein
VASQARTAPDLPDWLAAREPSLQRTANLLSGDVDRAQPLVLETLARLHLAWRRVRRSDDIDAEARRLLVGCFRTQSPRDPAADDRAVLVLRHHDHLTDPEIADLLRRSVGAVQAVSASDPTVVAREFADATDDTAYPTTPWATVVGRAQEIRRARSRTATKVTVACVAVLGLVAAGSFLLRGHDDDPTTVPVAPLAGLQQGAAPGVGYLVGHTFVPASGDPVMSPAFRRAATATPYDGGVLVAGRVTSRRPYATISRVADGSASRLGCGAPSFVVGVAGVPAYWLSDSCRAADPQRLVEGDTGRLVEGSTRAATTAVVAFTPVGRVSDGVVAYGSSSSLTVGNAAYVLQADDGASRLVSHVEVPRGATPFGDLVAGLAPGLTDSLVVDTSTGEVRWRLPDWSLGRFSPAGRYVVGIHSGARPPLGSGGDVVGVFDAATGKEVVQRPLPGLLLDSLPVWEDDHSVLLVAEDRAGRQAIIRVGLDGSVTRATPVGPAVLSGYRFAATP